MIKLDLFKLHDEKEDKGLYRWILASGRGLSEEVENLLSEIYLKIKRRKLDSLLISKLKISDITSQRLRRKDRKWYPIIFLQTLIQIWKGYYNKNDKDVEILKNSIISKVEYLKCNNPASKPVKAVKELTIDLCKISGAHAADGTLYDSYIAISDEDRQAVEKFKQWIKNSFEINLAEVKRSKGKYEWSLAFHNKIISRYLNKFFGFPSGTKVYSVDEPEIIKSSKIEFREAFVLGVLTFEAGIGMKPKVEFCISSIMLGNSIYEILELSNFKVTKNESGKYWRFWTGKFSIEEANKWLDMFEHGTEKWYKIYEIINGYQGEINSIEDAIFVFDKIYHGKSGNKVTLKDVIRIILKLKEVYRYQLVEKLKEMNNLASFGGKWAHSVSHYLNILKNANVVSVEKRSFGKKRRGGCIIREVYKLNPNVISWKVPFRPWLVDKINYAK